MQAPTPADETPSIRHSVTVRIPADVVAKNLRPPHVPDTAQLDPYQSQVIDVGDQRDPRFGGVVLVWTWEQGSG